MTASPAATDRSRWPRLSAVTSRAAQQAHGPGLDGQRDRLGAHLAQQDHDPDPGDGTELVQGGDALGGDGVEDHEADVHVPVRRRGLEVRQLAEHGPQARPRQRVAALHADAQPHPRRVVGERGQVDRRRRRRPWHRRRRHPDSVPSGAQQPLHKNSTRPDGPHEHCRVPGTSLGRDNADMGADVEQVLAAIGRAAQRHDRADLQARVELAQARLADPACRVVVCGEFKKGKSSLVNALLGARVCATDADVATAIPTYVRWGERLEAHVLDEESPGSARGAAVAAAEVDTVATGHAGPSARALEIRLPRELLAGGLVLVDTPGISGGLASAHAGVALRALAVADVLVFVTDAGAELGAAEIEFLAQAAALCPVVVGRGDAHRPVPAVAADRRGRRGAPACGGPGDRPVPAVRAAAPPRPARGRPRPAARVGIPPADRPARRRARRASPGREGRRPPPWAPASSASWSPSSRRSAAASTRTRPPGSSGRRGRGRGSRRPTCGPPAHGGSRCCSTAWRTSGRRSSWTSRCASGPCAGRRPSGSRRCRRRASPPTSDRGCSSAPPSCSSTTRASRARTPTRSRTPSPSSSGRRRPSCAAVSTSAPTSRAWCATSRSRRPGPPRRRGSTWASSPCAAGRPAR